MTREEILDRVLQTVRDIVAEADARHEVDKIPITVDALASVAIGGATALLKHRETGTFFDTYDCMRLAAVLVHLVREVEAETPLHGEAS